MKNSMNSLRQILTAIALLMVVNVALAQSRISPDVSNFHALKVSSAFLVEVSVGNTESLEIEIDERYADDLIAEVRSGTLMIGFKDGDRWGKNRRMKESPRAYVTVKSLDEIDISGAVNLKTLDILKGDKLDVEMSGASVVSLEVEVEDFYIQASGACVINVQGSTDSQTVKTTGATTYRAYDLESKTADIRVTGAGSARVSVSDELDVRASGASSVRYQGSPRVNSDTSGASSVRRG